MPVLNALVTNFTSGELDPKMFGRVGTSAYTNGMAKLRNVLLYTTGGGESRPGTMDFGPLSPTTRLVPFEFSFDQRYVLALSPNRLTVFRPSGEQLLVLNGQPWSPDDLEVLQTTQSGDTMIVTCTRWQTRMIRRTADAVFEVVLFEFDSASNGEKTYRPFFKFAPAAATLSVSAATGSVTVTASQPVFVPNHDGTRLRIGDTELLITAVTSDTVVTATVYGTILSRYALDPFRVFEGQSKVEVLHVLHGLTTGASVTISNAGGLGGIAATGINGARTITVLDDDRYEFTAGSAATESAIGGGSAVDYQVVGAGTRAWQEEAFGPVNGWPGACAFHDERLWLGGSRSLPDGLLGSRVSLPFNFDIGTGLDDESVQGSIGTEDVSSIRSIFSNGDLLVLTATAVMFMPVPVGQPVITPLNAKAKRTPCSGVGNVTPASFDQATLVIQENGATVFELLRNDQSVETRFTAADTALLSGHLLQAPVDLDTIQGTGTRGEQYAFVVNSDGTVAVFLSARSESVAAWSLWDMGTAKVRAVCCLGSDVFFAVERAAGWRLEKLATTDDWILDGAVTVAVPTPRTTFTLPNQYWGQLVDVAVGPDYIGQYLVGPYGELVLLDPYQTINVGFGFLAKFVTLPVDVQLPIGPQTGEKKRIVKAAIKVQGTYSAAIQGRRITLRNAQDLVENGLQGFTGSKEIGGLKGWSIDAQLTVEQLEPGKLKLLGISMRVQV